MLNPAIRRYWPQYKWSNMLAMVKNMKKGPKRCAEAYRDRLVVITGATSGVGYHTARKYAAMGAHVVSRRAPRGREAHVVADRIGAAGINAP